MELLWAIGPALPKSLLYILVETNVGEEMEVIEDMDGEDENDENSDDAISDEEE